MNLDVEIQELKDAYSARKVAKATIRAEVREKYRAVMAEEIESRQMENDVRFAKRMLRAKESLGLTIRDLQDEVLKTRTWSVWEYWRDLMGIEPERVSASLEKEARKPYRLEEGEWYAVKNEEGDIDPIRLDILERKDGFAIWPPMDEQDHGYESYVKNFGRNQKRFNDFIVAAFKKYGDDPFEKGTGL